MSEMKELKRFIYSATVTSGSGSQSFYIDAESREEADERAANNESDGMYADDSEVTDLDALDYEDETTVDDFGDFPLISREQSLIAQLEAAQKLNPLLVNVSELEATYIGDIRLHMAAISDWKLRAETAEAALSAANERTLAPVILEIANERLRQISVEGWTPEHDDQHSSGELAGAAGCYAKHVNARQWCFKNNPDDYQCEPEPSGWPWAAEWWKPKNPRSDLIRAAALIVAELERLDRASKLVEGNADAE